MPFYNLSTPGAWDSLGIDGAADFYDAAHVNAVGATKVSKELAKILQEDFDLPDHRGDAAYSTWDRGWEEFHAAYAEYLVEFGY